MPDHRLGGCHDGAHLRDTTLKTLTAAQKLSGEIDVLVAGQGVAAVAAAAAQAAGVRKVLTAESAELKADIAEDVAAVVVSIAGGYEVVAFAATAAVQDGAEALQASVERRAPRFTGQ